MWPQITILAMAGVGLLISANRHDKERTKENFWITLLAVAIGQTLLYFGGFYSNLGN